MMASAAGRRDQHLSLQEAADLLGVHYMTAYRYVRTGQLSATQVGNRWRVRRSSLDKIAKPRSPGRARLGVRSDHRLDSRRLGALLVGGDEVQAWGMVQRLLTSSCSPEDLYLEVLGPALKFVGDGWAGGSISVAQEHRASAVTSRLIGRLGPLFIRRGRSRGSVVLGSPSGEYHGLATGFVADVLRGRGFAVADLGATTPAESFVEAIGNAERLKAVGIAVSSPVPDAVVADTVVAVRSATSVPLLLGGYAIRDDAHARRLGADASTRSTRDAVDWFDAHS